MINIGWLMVMTSLWSHFDVRQMCEFWGKLLGMTVYKKLLGFGDSFWYVKDYDLTFLSKVSFKVLCKGRIRDVSNTLICSVVSTKSMHNNVNSNSIESLCCKVVEYFF